MRRAIAVLAAAVVLCGALAATSGTAVNAAPSHSVAAKAKKCSNGAYKHYRCYIVPPKGKFKIKVPHNTGIRLEGKGNIPQAGHQILIHQITVPGLKKNEIAFKVITKGTIPPLKLTSKGTLYEYNPTTGKWYKVSAVTGTGIYKVVNP